MDTKVNTPQAVASVIAVEGQAFARNPAGEMRPLHAGDVLLQGDTIVTLPGGQVQLAFSDGHLLSVLPNEVYHLGPEVALNTRPEVSEASLAASDVDRVIQVLNQGGDLNVELEDTAAGLNGGAANDAGISFVRLMRVAEGVEGQSTTLSGEVTPGTANNSESEAITGPTLQSLGTLGTESSASGPVGRSDLVTGTEDTKTTFLASQLLGNDTGTSLTIASVSSGTGGTAVLNPDGTVTFTPNPNFNGIASFSYVATDGTKNTDSTVVTVNVAAVNDAPTAANTSVSTSEDTVLTGSLPAASDVENDPIIYALGNNATHGTVSVAANGSYTYTPNLNYNGTDNFSYTVNDGQGGSNTYTVNVNVTPVNDAPIAVNDINGIVKNATSAITGNVLSNDTDVENNPLSVTNSGTQALTYGTLVLHNDGSYSYTVNAENPTVAALGNGEKLTDSFIYQISDGQGGSASATLSITISGLNGTPVVKADLASATEDIVTFATGNVLSNDSNPNNNVLTVSAVNGNAGSVGAAVSGIYGSVNIGSTGIYTYTLNNSSVAVQELKAGQTVTDSFTYTADNGNGGTATTTLTITINGSNDAPIANPDTLAAIQNTPVTYSVAQLVGNDTDVDGNILSIASVTSGTGGTAVLNLNGTVTFTPNANFSGPASFSYVASDGITTSNSAAVTVNVAVVNSAPLAVADVAAVNEDATINIPAISGVLSNDSDADGNKLTVSSVAFGANAGNVGSPLSGTYGTLTLHSDGSYSYVANGSAAQALATGVVATETFRYTANDGIANSNSATLTFTITGTNDPAVISTATANLVETNAVLTASGILTITDVDSPATFVAATVVGTYGSLSINAAGNWTYTANSAHNEFVGGTTYSDTFTVSSADGTTSTVTVNILGTNDGPIAVADTGTTLEDTSLVGNVLSNDSDVDGGTLTVTQFVVGATTFAANSVANISGVGTLQINTNGSYTFNPAANYSGSVPVATYTVSDGQGASASATLNINVTAVADAPELFAATQVNALIAGVNTISTTAGILQANLESTLGLKSGTLDGFDPPPGATTNDPGTINVIDGALSNFNYHLNAGSTVSFTWSFTNGENVVSEINAGYNDQVVLVVTAPDGTQTSSSLISSEQLGPNTTNAVFTATTNFTPPTEGDYQFSWLVLNGLDPNKDSSLAINNVSIQSGSTLYGAAIDLPISAGLRDLDGSETLSVTISGAPAGATFSAGTHLANGDWLFTPAQLTGLSFLPADGFTGTVNLGVTATATEISNGSFATTTQTISVNVSETTTTLTGTQANDTLTGTSGNDHIQGLAGDDTVNAGSGNDLVYGGVGNDTLNGEDGNDRLYGQAGTDVLNGGNGNDTLIGGSGNDTLTGGTGSDIFRWELADQGVAGTPAKDTITDFSTAAPAAGGDVLDLRDLLVGELHSGSVTGNLSDFLHFEKVSVGANTNTVLHVSTSGGFAAGFSAAAENQTITLQNVDLVTGFSGDNAIIQNLLTQNKLITD